MGGGEFAAGGGGAGLEEKGGALGRGVDDMAGLEVEKLALVFDCSDAVGVCVFVFFLVQGDGVVGPAAFP